MGLNNIFNQASLCDMVHLCIDLQKAYIGRGDKALEENLTQNVAPQFLDLGIPTYWVYYDVYTPSFNTKELYKVFPQTKRDDLSDMIVQQNGYYFLPKFETSAMSSTAIKAQLIGDGKKVLLVSGLTYAACVADTMFDAVRQGYKVVLMVDGTDYDDCFDMIESQLKNKGVVYSTASDVLTAAQRLKQRGNDYLPVYSI